MFNMTTQFGGGKTHALTLLYHLAQAGQKAANWKGVQTLLDQTGVTEVPEAATAVFVGTEFDPIAGRGGDSGTPVRKTPWGEIAWQLGGLAAFRIVKKHDETGTAPGGDVIRRILPADRPVLVLLDELMNFASRSRNSGLGGQFHSFLQNLSEVARMRDNVVMAVSVPASEFEMTAEDQSDYLRLKKLLDRVGKAVIMSVEAETSEIIRRRLFEWGGLHADASNTASEYAAWMAAHRRQLPSWFPVDDAPEVLTTSYPFHPSVLSVFERKWQALPRFQRTRGVLRLLALWVSHAYAAGFKGAHDDPLITLGTAPLEDSTFRAAVFEQLGESKLEAAVTTDIVGKKHAHALRLDNEAAADTRRARLHRKVATTIFFESNGGQQREEATAPEVRLATAEPGIDIGNVEQSLEALVNACYFLSVEKNCYRFGLQPNLNKLVADRRANVGESAVRDRVRHQIQRVFAAGRGVDRVYFPERTNDVPDRAALTLVVLAPEHEPGNRATTQLMEAMASEHGSSSRTCKSALLWCVAEDGALLSEEARKTIAWEDIEAESDRLRIDESQRSQLAHNLRRARQDLLEAVWRTYKNVFLLEEDRKFRRINLGLVHSSAATSLPDLVLERLQQEDLVVDSVAPDFLVRNWPPALPEWSTTAVRDVFYASPRFPRLRDPHAVKRMISRGVMTGTLAYVGKAPHGKYEPFVFKAQLGEDDVELANDTFLLSGKAAEAYRTRQESGGGTETDPVTPPAEDSSGHATCSSSSTNGAPPVPTAESEVVSALCWNGEVMPRKWMNFYTKVLAPFATSEGLTLLVKVELKPVGGVPKARVEEMRVALRDLGLNEEVEEVGRS